MDKNDSVLVFQNVYFSMSLKQTYSLNMVKYSLQITNSSSFLWVYIKKWKENE